MPPVESWRYHQVNIARSLVVAISNEVVAKGTSGLVHFVVVVGAEIVIFASHESLGGVGGAIRTSNLGHFLDALTLGCMTHSVRHRDLGRAGARLEGQSGA